MLTGSVTPAQAEIIRNALVSTADEMSATIVQTAYSPLLYDIKDFGVTILSARGEMWAEASGLAVFLGALRGTMQRFLASHPDHQFSEDDVYIANCPYLTGTHISDTAVYMPVFHSGRLIAFAATMAHWADIGGRSPGGWDPSSTDITMEGLRFTHQKLYSGGDRNDAMYQLIESNVRLPKQVLGDLAAQIAACRTASDRIGWLCDKYGSARVDAAMTGVIEATRKHQRECVAAIPDGRWSGFQRLDFDGVDREYQPEISVELCIEGSDLIVNLNGCSGTAPGPINCPDIGARSVVLAAIKGAFTPNEPTNEGHLSFVDFVELTDHLLVNPSDPAPCDSYGIVCRTLVETTTRILAGPLPDRSRAGGYQMVACYIMRSTVNEDRRFTYTEPMPGGYGAFQGSDGSTLVFGGDTPLLPIEVMEARYPLMCEELEFDLESAGAGEFRGGFGIKRRLRVLQENCMVKPSFESVGDPLAKGLAGGETGKPTRLEVTYPDGEHMTLVERPEQFLVPAETVVEIHTGGGGGFGRAKERNPERVLSDFKDDLINEEQARSVYGVVIHQGDDGLSVDAEATAALRASEHVPSSES